MNKIIDIFPVENYKTKQSFKTRKIFELLKKQHYKCNHCSSIALECVVIYDINSGCIDNHITAIRADGVESRMTIDHIIPKSKGGVNGKENCQVLCLKCNQKKGNKLIKRKKNASR